MRILGKSDSQIEKKKKQAKIERMVSEDLVLHKNGDSITHCYLVVFLLGRSPKVITFMFVIPT